ncbi:hypothetical protein PQR64_28950 [Paraburkholderia phytofirmans]|uniref:BPSL0761 family protein n=1 Tax=Paraburkholderia phytofirmans TaxID=261302 RepID=UPI0038BA9561
MEIDDDFVHATIGTARVLSMTLCFVPLPRVADICYFEPDARTSSAIGKCDGSFTFWHSDGKYSSVDAGETIDLTRLQQFAKNLYVAVFDHNDRRFSTSMGVPNALSMTVSFLDTPRITEIRYLEPDGRITTATEFIEGCFRFLYSNGGVHNRALNGRIDLAGLERFAARLHETVFDDDPNDTPAERNCALLQAREFLMTLSRGPSSEVPERVRAEAIALLRHYPSAGDIELIASGCCSWLAAPR